MADNDTNGMLFTEDDAPASPAEPQREERMILCLEGGVDNGPLIRQAARMAQGRALSWLVVSVEDGFYRRLPAQAQQALAQDLVSAERSGAEAVVLQAEDAATVVLELAERRMVDLILVGRSRRPLWRQVFEGRGLADTLMRDADGIDILIANRDEGAEPLRTVPAFSAATAEEERKRWLDYLWAGLGVAMVDGLGLAFFRHIPKHVPLSSLLLLFLMVVLLSGLRLGRGPAVLAALLSFVSFNFFFTAPHYTFVISDRENAVALFFFVVVALVAGSLANRLRDQIESTRLNARRMGILYAFNRKIAAAATRDDVLWVVVHHVASLMEGRSLVLMPEEDEERLSVIAGYPPEDRLDEDSMKAARQAWEESVPAGHGTDRHSGTEWLFIPLKTVHGRFGVLGVQASDGRPLTTTKQESLLLSLADQVAIALERTAFVADIEKARLAAEGQRLRNALLASLANNLQVPLEAIGKATDDLIENEKIDPAERRLRQWTIHDETERLNRFVQNLHALSRLGAGTLKPKREWVDLRDMVRSAQEKAGRLLSGRVVRYDMPDDMPKLFVDPMLLEQVFFHLLDNAARYAPAKTPVLVWARVHPGRILVEVCDEGPGISPEARANIFEASYRIEEDAEQTTGTGLGLAISCGIVKAHGGTIRAAAGMNDSGACILISLPLDENAKAGGSR